MVRQLGGSFGIALINTFIVKRVGEHRVELLSHLSPYDPAAVARLDAIKQTATMKSGLSPAGAELAALNSLEGTLTVQSHHLAYMDAFMLVALLFAIALPLLFFIKIKKEEKADLLAAH
jgi:DHA2 family multidrug resistance protein